MWNHIKEYWHRYVGGSAAAFIAAILISQMNTAVPNSPVVKWVSNTTVELVQPFVSTSGIYIIHEEIGFQSDGASEPIATWTALGLNPFSGASIEASFDHDGLYEAELLPRDTCDLIFKERLLANGVAEEKANAMYLAVHAGGAAVWARHTTQSVAEARKLVHLERQ